MFTFLGDGYLPPRLAPCPGTSWQDVASFFIVISIGMTFIEGLNWAAWWITCDLRERSNSEGDTETLRGDLVIPGGWIGLAFGLILLIVPYVLHDPSQCEQFYSGKVSVRYFVGALMLSYGALLVGQLFRDVNSRVSSQKLQ